MTGLSVVLLVLFIIVCILIVCLVLLQNEQGDSLGGLFAGGGNSAFGARSGNVLTKATYIMIVCFFVATFFLALLNRSPGDVGLQEEAQQQQIENSKEWWKENQNETSNEEQKVEESSDAKESASEQSVN